MCKSTSIFNQLFWRVILFLLSTCKERGQIFCCWIVFLFLSFKNLTHNWGFSIRFWVSCLNFSINVWLFSRKSTFFIKWRVFRFRGCLSRLFADIWTKSRSSHSFFKNWVNINFLYLFHWFNWRDCYATFWILRLNFFVLWLSQNNSFWQTWRPLIPFMHLTVFLRWLIFSKWMTAWGVIQKFFNICFFIHICYFFIKVTRGQS